MDPSKSPDPLILLLNEIDILLAQMRLFELCLKQAQAKAAYEISQAQEQSRAELARVRAVLMESEQAHAARLADASVAQEKLLERVKAFEGELAEKQNRLDRCEAELEIARARSASLCDQVGRLEISQALAQSSLEQSDEARRRIDLALADQQRLFEAQGRELQERQVVWQEIERDLRTQLATMQQQLAEAVSSTDAAKSALKQATHGAAAARQRAAELESSLAETQTNAARELEEARLDYAANLDRARTALAEREQSLQRAKAEAAEIERSLKTELITLRSQLDQKQELVEFRDVELRDAQSQITLLKKRAGELEKANQVAAVHAHDLEEARRSFERQVDWLRHEVAVRERALTERQEAVTAVEIALHDKIQELQQRLARSRREVDERNSELQRVTGELSTLQGCIEQQASAAAANLAARQAAEENWRIVEADNRTLRSLLAEKDKTVREWQGRAVSAGEQANTEIEQWQSRFEEQRDIAELASAEVERLRSAIMAVEKRGAEEQCSHQELEDQLRRTAALCQELKIQLQAKADELRAAEARGSAAILVREANLKTTTERLNGEIDQLRSHCHEQDIVAGQVREELARLRSVNTVLEEQCIRSEQLYGELEQRWQEANAEQQRLQAALQTKDNELTAALSAAQAVKGQADTTIQQLQLRLAETQLIVESRATEGNNLKTELARLTKQSAARDSAESEIQRQLRAEVELARAGHLAQVAALADEYQLKQQNLERDLSEERRRVGELREQLGESERRTFALVTEIDESRQALHGATADSTELCARIEQLEKLRQSEVAAAEQNNHQTRTKLEAELAAVRQELQAKAWLTAQQQASVENLALSHKNQIHNLEAKIAETQHQLEARDLDLEKSRSQARTFEGRIEELTSALQRAERATVERAVQVKEEYGLRIAELERQVIQKTSELRECGVSESAREQNLRQEIERLVFEAQERTRILQSRNDELVRVKAAMDALQDRLSEIEVTAASAAEAAAAESERMHCEFQAQLVLLQAELSQKEWALEERQAVARGVEQKHREEIERLRQQLDEPPSPEPQERSDLVIGEAKLNRADVVELSIAAARTVNGNETSTLSHLQRWQSGFGRKRRWKSADTR